MKERPILFSAPMVRALLDGSKTQTRRAINPQPVPWCQGLSLPKYSATPLPEFLLGAPIFACPYGKVGDRLWVRETFAYGLCTESSFAYKATHKPSDLEEGWNDPIKWKPSIHMPRWASRINLEITGVRVERLNDISEADAAAEGFDLQSAEGQGFKFKARHNFKFTWDSIYKNWDKNPWVWVVEFKVVK